MGNMITKCNKKTIHLHFYTGKNKWKNNTEKLHKKIFF